jgi:ABC-2 type transport system ATP-binding protein
MIEAVHLSKRYPDGTLALDALNLRVEPGEIYCLVGAPGAGKTTVIDLFLSFTQPTAGRALVAGLDVTREPLAARSRLAYLAAGTAFYGRLTALQNLELLARLGGGPHRGVDDCAMALRRVGLPEAAFEQKVASFSPGMTRKLGVAAVLLKEAPAVLLDEPLSGIDPRSVAEVVELLEELRDAGKALLVTLEEVFWARQLASRIGVLQDGRQVMTRGRDELRHENLERLYLETLRSHPRPLR